MAIRKSRDLSAHLGKPEDVTLGMYASLRDVTFLTEMQLRVARPCTPQSTTFFQSTCDGHLLRL